MLVNSATSGILAKKNLKFYYWIRQGKLKLQLLSQIESRKRITIHVDYSNIFIFKLYIWMHKLINEMYIHYSCWLHARIDPTRLITYQLYILTFSCISMVFQSLSYLDIWLFQQFCAIHSSSSVPVRFAKNK